MISDSAGALLLAHDSPLVREGLADALRDAGTPDVREATDLDVAAAMLAERPSQLTVCGTELAEGDVAGLVLHLDQVGSRAVVLLAPSVHEPDLLVALEAGALGYLSRESPLERVVDDIQGALRGEACLPRDKLAPVLRLLINRRRQDDERAARLARLSKRETEVFHLVATGATNDEIAKALFLAPATVRTHVQNILTKLEVHSRLEAVALAHEHSSIPEVSADVPPPQE